MHFLTTAISLLSLASTIQVLASPLSFTDIERRWSAGESDVSSTPKPPLPPSLPIPQATNRQTIKRRNNPANKTKPKGLNPRPTQPPFRLPRLAPRPDPPLFFARSQRCFRRILRRRHAAGRHRQAEHGLVGPVGPNPRFCHEVVA